MKPSRKFVRVRERNQITLPAEILEGLPIQVGDFLDVRTAHGIILLRPTRLVAVNTPAAKREEDVADREIREGRYNTFRGAEDAADALKRRRKRKAPAAALGAAGD